jgi:quinol monooxygenase YgiN
LASAFNRWFANENQLRGKELPCRRWIAVHSLGPPPWVALRPPFLLLHPPWRRDRQATFVIAEIVSKKDKADDLRALMVPFAEKAAKEPGCLGYTLLEVIGEPGRFLTFERWTDKAALDGHMVTPEIKAIVPKLEPVLAKPFTQLFLDARTGG